VSDDHASADASPGFEPKRGDFGVMVMVANSSGIRTGYIAGRYPGLLGHLYSPGAQRGPWEFMPYALDNWRYVCWSKGLIWNEPAWMSLLTWAQRAELPPLWGLVPDLPANREGTLAEWKKYAPIVRSFGFRPAFAVQNGMTFEDVPDSECMLFLGGTIDWKEAAIEPWCARFPGRVHVGRVDAWPRLIKCYRAGAVSVDGTSWFRRDGYKTIEEGQAAQLRRFLELQQGESDR
jgi:hypothetical protein